MSGAPADASVRSPTAPGRLGVAIPAQELADYLVALGRWSADRRAELDRLDAAALAARDSDSYTADLALALSVWQAADGRLQDLRRAWAGGRVGPTQREEMSRLIWGRLSPQSGADVGAGLGVSLVEAGRLSDALTSALRARLSFDPRASDTAARLSAIRAALHRCQELAERDPDTAAGRSLGPLGRRLDRLATDAAAGADVSGPLAALDASVALAERDLIVAAATRHGLRSTRVAVQARRDELESREDALRPVAARCRRLIADPPRLAIPDLDALGEVPERPEAVAAFAARLARVAAALGVVEAAYGNPLAELDELGGRLLGYRAKAAATGKAGDPAVQEAYRAALAAVRARPCRLPEARRLVTDYQRLVSGPGRLSAPGPIAGSGADAADSASRRG